MKMQFQSGTVQQFVESMQLKHKWNMKQQKMQKSPFQAQLEKSREDSKMSGIVSKLKSGKKLSPAEKEYLRAKNPELLRKAEMIEQERHAYEEGLSKCETKEEAREYHHNKIREIASQMQAVNQSGMSGDAKMMAMDMITMRMAAVSDAFSSFVTEGSFARLPSEEELERKAETEKPLESEDPVEDKDSEENEKPVEDPETLPNPSTEAPAYVEKPEAPEAPKLPESEPAAPPPVFTYTAQAEKKPQKREDETSFSKVV